MSHSRICHTVLAMVGVFLSAPALYAQPNAEDVKGLVAKYQAERDAVAKSGLAERCPPGLVERADVLAKKGEAALTGGHLKQAADALRQARWQLPYEAPGTPREHVARILGNPRLRHAQPVHALVISPDGQRLVAASAVSSVGTRNHAVKVWDLANGHEVLSYEGLDDVVTQLAFSPDGATVAASGTAPVIHLWDPKTGKDRRTLTLANGDHVRALAFSRDGKFLFAGFAARPKTTGAGARGVLACFDVMTGEVKRTDIDFPKPIASLACSDDGTIVAAAVEDGQVRLWQYPKMIEEPKQPVYWARQHDAGALYAVAISPDSKTLVCSGPDSAKLYAMPVPGAKPAVSNPRLTLPTTFCRSLAFSRDGKSLFTAGSTDGQIRYWDPATGEQLGAFKGNAGMVRAIAFNPAANQLASASFDHMIRLWDFDVALTARDVGQHEGPVWSAAFSPEGDRVISAGSDRVVRVWDLVAGKAMLTLGHPAPVNAVLFSADGKYIASGGADKALRLWDASSGAALRSGEGHTAMITSLDISADSRRIVTGSMDRRVKIWDAETGKELLSVDNPGLVASVAFRPDGKQVAVGSADQTIALYDSAGKLEQRWTAHGIAVNCVAYSPNGQLLASGGNDALVKVWTVARPADPPIVLTGHTGPVSGVAFRKDNQHVVSAGGDQLVKLWRLEGNAGKEVQTFRGHKDWVTSAAFNKDGSLIVSASVDHHVKTWEVTSREAPLLAEHTGYVETVGVSPDGKYIASGSLDGTIKLWDRTTGGLVGSLAGHPSGVRAVAYAPDGKILVSSGYTDRMIRLWDPIALRELPRTAEQNLTFQNMSGNSPYLFVTPDGNRLYAWFPVTSQGGITTMVDCFQLAPARRAFDFKEMGRKVGSLAYCANGKLAATGAEDGSVRIWKLEENRAVVAPGGDWPLFGKVGVADIALTPDGLTLIATSNAGEVKIADITRREVRQTLTAHPKSRILSCQASPDGKRFVTLGDDAVLKCWDLDSGKELRQWVIGQPTAAGHGSLVGTVTFTPDSRQVVTANADSTLFVLDLP
jgi:WD40 repeat protein